MFYVGAMFHDVGLVDGHRSTDERFEVDGANAARAFLERHGLPEEQVTGHDPPGVDRLALYPRTGFKSGIIELFSEGMRDNPETAYGTMNADILEATVPGYVRPNACDLIRDAPSPT